MMTIAETVQLWLNSSKDQIISNYDRDNMRASGSFAKSLRVEVLQQSGLIKGTLHGAHHSLYVDKGRGKTSGGGNGQLREAIKQWIDDKGITPRDNISKDSLAFLISRKIHREGWKPKNSYPNGVISSVINDNAIKDLLSSLGANVKLQVKNDIWQSFA